MYHALIMCDLRIIGSNPECADLTNPNGNLFGEAAFLVVENEKGYRWQRPEILGINLTEDQKQHAVDILEDAIIAGFNPAEEWEAIRPAYGSDAYVESGQEQLDIEAERAERCW